jgi:hypothetical protein
MRMSEFRRLDPNFFILIRTIMDSYWSEMLLVTDLRLLPKFADFLYLIFYLLNEGSTGFVISH